MVDFRWLKRYKEGRKDGSLIIDFETPEGANAIIKAGTIAYYHGLSPDKEVRQCVPIWSYFGTANPQR